MHGTPTADDSALATAAYYTAVIGAGLCAGAVTALRGGSVRQVIGIWNGASLAVVAGYAALQLRRRPAA